MRKLIKTDGTEIDLIGPTSMEDIRRMIGANMLDTVGLRHMGLPLHVMCVDDGGWECEDVQHSATHFERRPVRALKPINEKATELYLANCRPGTTHQIVGDVVIVPDEDYA
jgi:hypothetical protein